MYVSNPETPTKVLTQMWFWGALAIVVFLSIALELCVAALQRILYLALKPEARLRFDAQHALVKAKRKHWLISTYKKLLGSKPIEEEADIILDHDYDGIRELDNNLPPWWVYSFYATIVFGAIYLIRFHVFNDLNQAEEYAYEVKIAEAQIAEWKKTAKDLVDANTVTLLTDAVDIKAGKTIFLERCIACHKSDGGGGIGPNLTDAHWILGGGIKNVFNTISEGGRSGKGMIAWKTELKPSQIAQVASFVLSLQGTTPADPKAPEGDIWETEVIEETAKETLDKTTGA